MGLCLPISRMATSDANRPNILSEASTMYQRASICPTFASVVRPAPLARRRIGLTAGAAVVMTLLSFEPGLFSSASHRMVVGLGQGSPNSLRHLPNTARNRPLAALWGKLIEYDLA